WARRWSRYRRRCVTCAHTTWTWSPSGSTCNRRSTTTRCCATGRRRSSRPWPTTATGWDSSTWPAARWCGRPTMPTKWPTPPATLTIPSLNRTVQRSSGLAHRYFGLDALDDHPDTPNPRVSERWPYLADRLVRGGQTDFVRSADRRFLEPGEDWCGMASKTGGFRSGPGAKGSNRRWPTSFPGRGYALEEPSPTGAGDGYGYGLGRRPDIARYGQVGRCWNGVVGGSEALLDDSSVRSRSRQARHAITLPRD